MSRSPPAAAATVPPRLEDVLFALADPVRLAIVRTLDRLGEQSCAALDGGRPKSTMSHHFRVLRDAGLVETRAVGPSHLNRLRRDTVEARFPGLLAVVLGAAAPPGAMPAVGVAASGGDPRPAAGCGDPRPVPSGIDRSRPPADLAPREEPPDCGPGARTVPGVRRDRSRR